MGDQSEQHFARFHENGRVSDSELTEIQEGIEGQKGMLQKLGQNSAFLNHQAKLLGGLMKDSNKSQGFMGIASGQSSYLYSYLQYCR